MLLSSCDMPLRLNITFTHITEHISAKTMLHSYHAFKNANFVSS